MKYKSALFWGGLIAAAGFVLFETSYEVQELEEKLGSLNRKIMVEQEAIQVLKAEWSFLNDPTRLETLSREHLALQPTEARQFVAMNIVPMRPSPTVAPEEAPLPPMVRNQTPGKTPNVATASTGDSVVGGGAIVQGGVQGGVIIPASTSPIKPAPIKPSAIVPASAKAPPLPAPLPSAAKAAPAPVVTTKPTEVAAKPPVTARTLAPPPPPAQHDSIGLLVARLGANR